MPIEPYRLTPEQKKALLDLEADIKVLASEIARAERAGIDMTDAKKDYDAAVKLRAGLLKEYA